MAENGSSTARNWHKERFKPKGQYKTITFNSPYLLFEFEDGWKYYEVIEAHAVDGADLSDVIFQYNHSGRVFARQSNKIPI